MPRIKNSDLLKHSNGVYAFVSVLKYARKTNMLNYEDNTKSNVIFRFGNDTLSYQFIKNLILNNNLDIRIQMIDIIICPPKLSTIPNYFELNLLKDFFQELGLRASD